MAQTVGWIDNRPCAISVHRPHCLHPLCDNRGNSLISPTHVGIVCSAAQGVDSVCHFELRGVSFGEGILRR
jgi:hypothetical protein